MSGARIIEGLKEAIAGDLDRVIIDGQVWVRIDPMNDRCPDPWIPGWTMRECWKAKKCSCAKGVELGYQPITMPKPSPLLTDTGECERMENE